MNSFWIIAGCLMTAAAADVYSDIINKEWNNFKLHYGKTYEKRNEDTFRKNIFLENWSMIARHNELYAQGLVTYELGINEFADMLHHEFLSQFTGFEAGELNETSTAESLTPSCQLKSPDTVDWRKRGAVTPVKNQGQCGSCWAFSTTGSLEAHHYLKTKTLVALSEQNLVDCSRRYGNHGCNGGNMEQAFEYIIKYGIDTEKSYPYRGTDTGSCRFNRDEVGAKMRMYVRIPPGSEKDLQSAIAVDGPVSVAVDASNISFMLYKDGVYYEPNCSPRILNHAVTVVGYGTTSDGIDYWLVKNSWGKSWGSDGYLKIARNRQNHCGIASYAMYPII